MPYSAHAFKLFAAVIAIAGTYSSAILTSHSSTLFVVTLVYTQSHREHNDARKCIRWLKSDVLYVLYDLHLQSLFVKYAKFLRRSALDWRPIGGYICFGKWIQSFFSSIHFGILESRIANFPQFCPLRWAARIFCVSCINFKRTYKHFNLHKSFYCFAPIRLELYNRLEREKIVLQKKLRARCRSTRNMDRLLRVFGSFFVIYESLFMEWRHLQQHRSWHLF